MRKLAALMAYGGAMLALAWGLEGASETRVTARIQGLPDIVSIADFFANENATWNYKISPDGKRLGWIGSHAGNSAVHYKILSEDEVRVISADRSITDFWWVQDSRRIFFSWDEFGDENWHLLTADTDRPDAAYVDVTPFPGVRVRVHQVFAHDPSTILIRMNRRDRSRFDMYRLNIDNGEEELLFEDPGDVSEWITTRQGEFLARVRTGEAGGWFVEVREEGGSWRKTFGGERDHLRTIGRPLDSRRVYALSNRGRDKVALVRIDLVSGREELVFEHDRVDIAGAWTGPGYELRGASYSPDYPVVKSFGPVMTRALADLQDGRRAGVEVTGVTRDQRFWTAMVERPTEGLSYYLYDTETREKTLIGRTDISRHKDGFGAMEPISFQARDGLRIDGYLTLPPVAGGKPFPMVLLVHPGPWSRVFWGYHHEVQFLVNRGYAVLQVNYRGSRGYGRRFMERGIGEFGRKMQHDLEDAVAWSVRRGIADAKRVAIYGWDYGGYAALEGLIQAPTLFAAGVAGSAPVDWTLALENLPPYDRPDLARYRTFLGDPRKPDDRAVLRDRSPIHRVDRIVRPLMLANGGNDVRGLTQETENVVAMLRQRDVPVEHLFIPNEGRWIQRWQSNVRFHRTLENFLGRHLGGRISPYHPVEIWQGLR